MMVDGWVMLAIPMASGERHREGSKAGCDGRLYASIPGRGEIDVVAAEGGGARTN